MAERFEYISTTRIVLKEGNKHAYLGEMKEPVVYGYQGTLYEQFSQGKEPPTASTLDHIVAAVGG